MHRHAGTRPTKATKIGVCLLLAGLAIVVVLYLLASITLELVTDMHVEPMRSLFVPNFAPGSEAVIDLASTNFSSLHAGASQCPWLVVFYSDGCGHCRSSAPALAKFAEEWVNGAPEVRQAGVEDRATAAVAAKSIVQMAVLNCREFNAPCRRHGVHGVPTIKLFLPTAAGGMEKGLAERSDSFKEVELEPHRGDYSDLKTMIVEELQSHVDTIPSTVIERCLSVRGTLLAAKTERLRAREATHPAANTTANATAASTEFKEERDVHATDVANAFFHTLHDEVALVGFDTAEQLSALMNFLKVVEESLPGLGAGVPLHYLKAKAALSTGAGATNSAITLPTARTNVTEWQQTVLHAGIAFKGTPAALSWRTCKGSSWQYRGFPCGLWLLYHFLTANSQGDLAPSQDPIVDHGVAHPRRAAIAMTEDGQRLQVLNVILDYARHYFSCKECREHFLMFKPAPGPTSRESAVLQLWRVHNIANYNLARMEGKSDPLVPKRQFPDAALCPQCINGTRTAAAASMRAWQDNAHAAKGSNEPQNERGQQQPPSPYIEEAARKTDGVVSASTADTVTFFDEAAVAKFLLERYAWDPTRLHNDPNPADAATEEAAAAAVVAAAAAARGEQTITIHRKPMALNTMLTMFAVVGLVGIGCARVLRSPSGAGGGHGSAAKQQAAPATGPGLITQVYGAKRRR